MTAQQKQDVVDFLGDWCLYSDWDSLVATFPNPEARFRVFTKAVIMKDIFHSLVENPFYYMDSDTHWDGRSEFLPPRHGQELFQHWQKILRVDEASAEKWRASTVQMMNRYLEPTIKTWRRPIAPVEGEDTSAGIRSWNVRVSLISPMLSEHDPEYAEPTEYPFRRHGLLRRAYEAACNFGVQMWVRDQYAYRFDDDIKGIGPYTKRKDPERDRRRWRVSDYTRFRNIDYTVGDGFEGRRTVMILWPTIWAVSCKQLSFNPGHSILDTFERTYFDDKEWLYLDDREWFYETAAEGLVYLGKEFVEPEGNHQK
ncbi:hypothetical protein N7456_002684 [Penicillium angulare]|uniref:Uncharacterized protein n=1 Tax=Penicillium angulare TaxID=116970 RepID=A0A9W9KQ50_9EURO|nr:hypothetical protein N7456_002684 [Penicillium angulare]